MKIVIATILLAFLTLSMSASTPESNALDQFARQTSLQDTFRFALSPDGLKLAYEVIRPTSDKQQSQIELRVVDLATKQRTVVCCDQLDATEASWSPDSKLLAFVRGKKKSESGQDGELSLYDFVRGQMVSSPHVHISTSSAIESNEYPRWIDQSHILVVNLSEPSLRQEAAESSVKVFDSFPGDPAPVATEQIAARRYDYQRNPLRAVSIVDIKTSKTTSVLNSARASRFSISPDGRYLAFLEYDGTLITELTSRYKVHIFDLKTGSDQQLAQPVFLYANTDQIFSWCSDSLTLAFPTLTGPSVSSGNATYKVIRLGTPIKTDDLDAWPIDSLPKLLPCVWSSSGKLVTGKIGTHIITWDVTTGHATHSSHVPEYVYEVVPTLGPDSEVVIVEKRASDRATIISTYQPLTGALRTKFVRDEQAVYQAGSALLAQNGAKLLLAAQSLNRSTEIESLSWSGDGEWLTDADNRPVSMYAKFEKLTWRGGNGDVIEGALLIPRAYNAAEPGALLPLVVRVYPSATNGIFANDYGLYGGVEELTLVAAGYAVFFPRCPTHPKSFASDLANDVLFGIQKVLDTQPIDPDRIALIGHSAGVDASLNLLTWSRQFKAAVLSDGLDDFIGDYGDITGYGQQGMEGRLGSPWQDPAGYLEASPVFRIDRVQVPILLFHNTGDPNVPLFLGEEIFANLRSANKVAQLVEYTSQGHTLSDRSLRQQIDSMSRTLQWLDRYVRATPEAVHNAN